MSEVSLRPTQRTLLARAIAYGLKQPDMKLAAGIYEKALTTIGDVLVESGVVTDRVYVELKRDLRAKQDQLFRITVSNVVTEMAHSMNRKALLDNDSVEPFIKEVLEGIKE